MSAYLYYLDLEIKVDTVISHIFLDSKYLMKCKFESTFIQLGTFTNLITLEFVQKCQHIQLCVLGKTQV